MQMLAEQPILVSVLLALVGLTLAYIWARGAPRAVGVGGLVAFGLIPIAWLVASLIETDQEAIRATIRRLATHVQANEIEAACEAIDPSLEGLVERAENELARYEFTRARVGRFNRLRVLDDRQPPEAVVDLIASVKVTARGTSLEDISVSRRLFLLLRKTPGGWKVIDYEHRPAVGGPDGFSTRSDTDWDALLKGNGG
jgi:hypothetical protein